MKKIKQDLKLKVANLPQIACLCVRQVVEHREIAQRRYDPGSQAQSPRWPPEGSTTIDHRPGQPDLLFGRGRFTRPMAEVRAGRIRIVASLAMRAS